MHDFLKVWSRFHPRPGRNYLAEDEEFLLERRASVSSWREFIERGQFGTDDGKLHLSLIPQPFMGNVDTAPVVILMLNPGLSPIDYFSEAHIRNYRRALIANLHLGFKHSRFPNLFLNPEFAWHTGFKYWHDRLGWLVDCFVNPDTRSRIDALSHLSKSIAMVQLVPYHSSVNKLSERVISNLESVRLARCYVKHVLLPRTSALLIVARGKRYWEIHDKAIQGKHVLVYEGSEARGAFLTSNSRGGKAILKHLRASSKELR